MELSSKKPRVIHHETKNGQLIITLDWFGVEKTKAVISKTPSGYHYENIGLMKRNFSNMEEILEEFEHPQILKNILEKLLVTEKHFFHIDSNAGPNDD